MRTALAVASMLVGTAATLSTLDRWLQRRRSHDLAWTIAFTLFTVAAGALAVGGAVGWDGGTFRLFFLCGAIANVPVLAVGTVFIHARPHVARLTALIVAATLCFAAGVIVSAPFTASVPVDRLAQGSDVFGPLPRILAAVASGGGAVVIVVGAVWSAIRGRRRFANALIALGTLTAGASGLLNSVADEETAFAATLALGVALLFVGYLAATASSTPGGEPSPLRSGATHRPH